MTAIEKLWALRAENTERTRKMADRTDEWNAERAAKPPKEMTAEEATQHEEFLESFRSVLGEDFGKEPAEPREPFNSHRSQLEKELARDEAIAQRFLFLKREFGFTESEVKLFAGPGSALFSCTEDELREKIPYFIELFCGTDNFKRVVSRSDIDRVDYYRGVLSYKDKELIEKKLCDIEKVFLTDRKGAIDLMCQSAYYTYYSPEHLLRKIVYHILHVMFLDSFSYLPPALVFAVGLLLFIDLKVSP